MKPDNLSFFKTLLFVALACCLSAGCISKNFEAARPVDAQACISTGWPHDKSDLTPDPALRYGILDNGLRYVVMHNEEPEDRVGLYLNIQAGSLEEQDNQRGYAHFLEHMLFNGTTNYPPGTLVEYFQSIGMGFGSDTNAHTAFDETVYRLLLPDGSEKNLRDGFLVMTDYARGALLLEDEVERERGIILAERRTRDSAGYRLYEKRMHFSFADTRAVERFPIGTEEALKVADSESLRSYYDSWYRPENMIFVMVGDIDHDLAEKMIVESFASLTAPDVNPECYDLGRIEEAGEHFLYVYEPEVGSTEISISSYWNTQPVVDNAARQQIEMKKYIAALLLRNRLKQIVREPDSPLTKAIAYSGDFLERIGYATVTATVEGVKWQEGLDLLSTNLRLAIEEGFTQRELERVKKEVMAEMEKDIQTASSRDSRKLAGDIINALNSNRVFLSPEQEMQLYGPVVDSLSLAEANAVFSQMWSRPNRKIFVAGTAVIDREETPEETVRKVYEKAMERKIDSWNQSESLAFPYLQISQDTGRITGKELVEDVDVHKYTFSNNTVLNVKKTSFQPNEVLMEVHFGSGKLSEQVPGLSMLAEAVVNESGVGRMNRDELDDALAGHNVSASFKIGSESFVLRGRGLSSEIELLVQLIWTKLLDPAFREDSYQLSMERFVQMYEQMESSVDGMMRLKGEQFLAGDNPHYGTPPLEHFQQLTLNQVREWLLPAFAGAPLEISVVGDIEPEEVAGIVARYFGLSDRQQEQKITQDQVVFPAGKNLKQNVVSQVDKALVTVAWPTDDFWNISRSRRLNILSSVFADRLRLEIREKLGAVYSPRVYNYSSRTAPGYGVMRAMLTVDPAQVQEVIEKVRQVGTTLAREKITSDELRRSLEPSLTSIKDMMQSNRYWMGSVMALSSRHPEQLEWPLTIQKDFGSITVDEILDFAQQYLGSENSADIVIMPTAP